MIMGSCDQWDHMMTGLYDQWVVESYRNNAEWTMND